MFSIKEGSLEGSSVYRFSSLRQTNKPQITKIKSILVVE